MSLLTTRSPKMIPIYQIESITMKLNDPRLTLLAGLALALNLNGSERVQGAEPKTLVKLVKAQSTANPSPAQTVPAIGAPALSTTPLVPIPDPSQGGVNQNLQSVPFNPSPVTTVPMQLGTQPSLTPTPRPPMGMHYGEQDRLDSYNNPTPRPLPTINNSGSVPINQFPQGVTGVPAIVEDPAMLGSPVGMAPAYGLTDRFGYAPPPGTLGQTYKRRSRPIEDTKHPRIGAVEINLPEEVDVTAKGLKPKWTGKLWRLESDSLIPGVPHIYEVKASWGEGTQPQVRTIRLIMGRIVDLEF